MATPTEDYQASVAGLLMGTDTPYHFGTAGIQGLGNPKAKTGDVELDFQDGSVGSPEYRDIRTFILHLEIVEDTAEAAYDLFGLLQAAWLPVADDIEFHLQLPGLGHYVWMGRPRELEPDITGLPLGHISCIATFVALDPQGAPA